MNDLEVWVIEQNWDDDCDNEWMICKNGEKEFAGTFDYVLGVLAKHLKLHPFDVATYRLRCLQTDQIIPGELFT